MTVVTAFAILTGCLFLAGLKWMFYDQKLQYIEEDISTLTVNDFAVEMEIKEECYKNWLKNEYAKPGGPKEKDISQNLAFQKYITGQIEEYLNKDMKALNKMVNKNIKRKKKRGEDADAPRKVDKIRIAEIIFAYNNQKVIELLRLRGMALQKHEWQKNDELKKELREILEDDFYYQETSKRKQREKKTCFGMFNTKYENITDLARPTCAFITFEEEDGKILALNRKHLDQNHPYLPEPFH
jgi:hypothetical protein